MSREKIIVIGGGVGPMAGVALHGKIIENTLTDGTDQSHLEVFHFSRSSSIPDRTEFILGNITENPAAAMAETFAIAMEAVTRTKKKAVGGIPCNTFHSPVVFKEFSRILRKEKVRIPVVHMLQETLVLLRTVVKPGGRVGILSTTGTRSTGVYRSLLGPEGYSVLEVPEETQAEIQEAIYNRTWGIKAVSPVTEKARETVRSMAHLLIRGGAEAVILACTELPLAMPEQSFQGVTLVDPVVALARALIREAAPEKLKPI